MQSVSETVVQTPRGCFQGGSGMSMTPDRSQALPSRSLVYHLRGLGSDRNLIENVPWREISQREGISD